MKKTRTWNLVDFPLRKSLVGCLWIYKIKTNCDGTIEPYKTRLIAKSYTQEYGVNYKKTFAPIAQLTLV